MARKITIAALFLLAAAAAPAALRPSATETPIVAPLADPAIVPGVARCTSDGACTVTDEAGTRPGTPLLAGEPSGT